MKVKEMLEMCTSTRIVRLCFIEQKKHGDVFDTCKERHIQDFKDAFLTRVEFSCFTNCNVEKFFVDNGVFVFDIGRINW